MRRSNGKRYMGFWGMNDVLRAFNCSASEHRYLTCHSLHRHGHLTQTHPRPILQKAFSTLNDFQPRMISNQPTLVCSAWEPQRYALRHATSMLGGAVLHHGSLDVTSR
jgi:hypothetical protein